MWLPMIFACQSSSSTPELASAPQQNTGEPVPSTPPSAPAGREGRPALPGLPVALFAGHDAHAVPLGGVPAVAPGDPAHAVQGAALSRWPIEGVDAATAEGEKRIFTGGGSVRCTPTGGARAGAVLNEPVAAGRLLVAPAAWGAGLVQWPTGGPDQALLDQLEARSVPTTKVVVANAGDLDGDGQPDRIVLAHGPQVDPEKPAPTTVLWWGETLTPLEGFDFNGAVQAQYHLATPGGPLVVLRSQWMGGSGLHVFAIEDSSPRALGEWVCGS